MAYAERKTLKSGKVVYYAVYTGPDGRRRTAGSFPSEREAEKAADTQEKTISNGHWVDPTESKMTFREYVDTYYWPTTAHLEVSTRAAYRYYLDKHFLPYFGDLPMKTITPSLVQSWVNEVSAATLAAPSVVKYHAVLHKIFSHAVIDRIVPTNACSHGELPKVVRQPKRIITAEQFEAILSRIPKRYRTMVLLAIETGLRWGELVALRPTDINFTDHVVTVRRMIVEVSKKNSPTGERCFVKEYPRTTNSVRCTSTRPPASDCGSTCSSVVSATVTCSSRLARGRCCRETRSARNSGCRRLEGETGAEGHLPQPACRPCLLAARWRRRHRRRSRAPRSSPDHDDTAVSRHAA